MYLISLNVYRYSGQDSSEIIGYKETLKDAIEYCNEKNKELKGTYNESMGYKEYFYKKIELL